MASALMSVQPLRECRAAMAALLAKKAACADAEDHPTIVARWRAAIENASRPILFSNCHNGCETDAKHRGGGLAGSSGDDDLILWQ